MSDVDVLMAVVGNVFAGFDTTTISLQSVFYHLIRNPKYIKRLVVEVDGMDRAGKLSEIGTAFRIGDMQYLEA